MEGPFVLIKLKHFLWTLASHWKNVHNVNNNQQIIRGIELVLDLKSFVLIVWIIRVFFHWIYQEYIVSNYTNIKHIHPIHINNPAYFAFEQLITNACNKYVNYGKFGHRIVEHTKKCNKKLKIRNEEEEGKEKKKQEKRKKRIDLQLNDLKILPT